MQQTTQRHSPSQPARFAHPKRNIAAIGLQQGMRVVDFGAGSGAYVLAIAERLQGSGTVYAVDIQRELLRRIHNEAARRGFRNVEVIWADLEMGRASKLAGASVDLVLISNLLFQVQGKGPVLREARRILKSSGHVVVIDWYDSFKGMGPIREDVVTKDAALALARKEGLELLREFEAGAHHYGLILQPTMSSV
ncbi:MAG: class I SAM-dependent methyltransferase [Candidatus Komeilibacteria bacterium]|nr:class I SAM-dependent methyltransferase [Candidatus Komeilibacteria bacterium]